MPLVRLISALQNLIGSLNLGKEMASLLARSPYYSREHRTDRRAAVVSTPQGPTISSLCIIGITIAQILLLVPRNSFHKIQRTSAIFEVPHKEDLKSPS